MTTLDKTNEEFLAMAREHCHSGWTTENIFQFQQSDVIALCKAVYSLGYEDGWDAAGEAAMEY